MATTYDVLVIGSGTAVQTAAFEPQQRAHSPSLAAGLASESKIDRIPYGRRFLATCGEVLQLDRNGLNVGLVEHSRRPGGTCALSGCQAKKWYYEGAETVARSRHLDGIGIASPASASWKQLTDAKNRFTADVPSDTVNRVKNAGIDFIIGRARFADERYHLYAQATPLTVRRPATAISIQAAARLHGTPHTQPTAHRLY